MNNVFKRIITLIGLLFYFIGVAYSQINYNFFGLNRINSSIENFNTFEYSNIKIYSENKESNEINKFLYIAINDYIDTIKAISGLEIDKKIQLIIFNSKYSFDQNNVSISSKQFLKYPIIINKRNLIVVYNNGNLNKIKTDIKLSLFNLLWDKNIIYSSDDKKLYNWIKNSINNTISNISENILNTDTLLFARDFYYNSDYSNTYFIKYLFNYSSNNFLKNLIFRLRQKKDINLSLNIVLKDKLKNIYQVFLSDLPQQFTFKNTIDSKSNKLLNYDIETFKTNNKKTTYSYPIWMDNYKSRPLNIDSNSNKVVIAYDFKLGIRLKVFDKKIKKYKNIDIRQIESINYLKIINNDKILISGHKNNINDIYIYNIINKKLENITKNDNFEVNFEINVDESIINYKSISVNGKNILYNSYNINENKIYYNNQFVSVDAQIDNYFVKVNLNFSERINTFCLDENKIFIKDIFVEDNIKPKLIKLSNDILLDFNNNEKIQPIRDQFGVFIHNSIGSSVKLNFSDILENNILSIGYKITSQISENSFHVNYINRSKKLDWSVSLKRISNVFNYNPNQNLWLDSNQITYPNLIKYKRYYLQFDIKYPFTNNISINFSNIFLYNKNIFLATNNHSLLYNNIDQKYYINNINITYEKYRYKSWDEEKFLNFKNVLEYKTYMKFFNDQFLSVSILNNFQFNLPLNKYVNYNTNLKFGNSFTNKKILFSLSGIDNSINKTVDSSSFQSQNSPYVFQEYIFGIRCYDLNVINGNSFIAINQDFIFDISNNLGIVSKYKFLNNIKIGLFYDGIFISDTDLFKNKFKYSYGAIFSTIFANYPIQLIYGFNNKLNGMLTISIGNK